MFGHSLPLCVIQFPSKRFGFVGSIPTALGEEVPASTAAVMGQRAHRNAAGEIVEWKFPSFDSEVDAINYATERGFIVAA